MGAEVVALTLLAAVAHAGWNALAHGVDDRLAGFVLIGVADTVVGGLAALVLGAPPPGLWPAILASAAVHVVYQVLLLTSYRLGEFSQVYPLARGTSPWVVAVVATLGLGRALPVGQLVGVLVISAGLIGLVAVGGRPSRAQLPALGAALATGLCIATYTVIDGEAVLRAPPLTYGAWMFLLQGPAPPLVGLVRRGRALAPQLRPVLGLGLGGGLVQLLAYGLVLVAQTGGALAPVAALRETSIVIGALLGAVFLGERLGRARSVASVVVVLGVLILSR